MDRFLLHVFVGYATDADEQKILQLVRGEDAAAAAENRRQRTDDRGQVAGDKAGVSSQPSTPPSLPSSAGSATKIPAQAIADARQEVLAVQVAPAVEKYMVALIAATRRPADYKDSKLAGWIKVGASPRGTLALDRCARARAWLAGRNTVTPDDVKAVAHACLRHRLILSYEAEAEGTTKDAVLEEVLKLVAVG